jgi:hypothetical protein
LVVTLIDGFVLLGFGVVVPLAFGAAWRWSIVAGLAAASFFIAEGAVAGALAVPAVLAAVALGVRSAADAGPIFFWRPTHVARLVASIFVVAAAGALLASRLGASPLGLTEPIVELTAVHYVYAGAAALTLAEATGRLPAMVLTAVAPPLIALGFLTGAALPQVGGAVLMAAGVWTTATWELRSALDSSITRRVRVLLAVSGLAIWAPTVLAVAWAAGQHWRIPILSIPDMARTHGAANALGFVLCGLVARRVERRKVAAA